MKGVVAAAGLFLAGCGYVTGEAVSEDALKGLGGEPQSHSSSGGSVSSGGSLASGGAPGTGGAVSTGGMLGGGGSEATGGMSATGGGESGTGGASASGGSTGETAKISDFVEDFSSDGLGTTWESQVRGDGCKLGILNGELRFAAAEEELGRCEVTSKGRFDLVESEVFISIPGIKDYYPELLVFFALVDAEGNRVQVAFQNGQFALTAEVDGEVKHSDSATYRSNYEYWRISESNESILIEASSNEVVWTLVGELSVPFDLGAVAINLGIEVADPMDGEVSISMLGVNTD